MVCGEFSKQLRQLIGRDVAFFAHNPQQRLSGLPGSAKLPTELNDVVLKRTGGACDRGLVSRRTCSGVRPTLQLVIVLPPLPVMAGLQVETVWFGAWPKAAAIPAIVPPATIRNEAVRRCEHVISDDRLEVPLVVLCHLMLLPVGPPGGGGPSVVETHVGHSLLGRDIAHPGCKTWQVL